MDNVKRNTKCLSTHHSVFIAKSICHIKEMFIFPCVTLMVNKTTALGYTFFQTCYFIQAPMHWSHHQLCPCLPKLNKRGLQKSLHFCHKLTHFESKGWKIAIISNQNLLMYTYTHYTYSSQCTDMKNLNLNNLIFYLALPSVIQTKQFCADPTEN